MSNLSSQISYLLRIAIDINKKIGGTKAYQAERKAKDKFSLLKDEISKKIYILRKAVERKSLQNNKLGWTLDEQDELKQKLRDVNSCLIRIKQSVQEQKSNETAKNLKMQIIQKLEQQYQSYEHLFTNHEDDITQRTSFDSRNKYQTLTQMRTHLIDDVSNIDSGRQMNRRNLNSKVTQLQIIKISEWDKRKEAVDDNLDALIDKTQSLKTSINQANKLVNEIDVKVKELTTNVDNLTDDLTKSNKKLKGIVEKFRRPHKFCCDVILVIIFIGLVVGCIKVSSQ